MSVNDNHNRTTKLDMGLAVPVHSILVCDCDLEERTEDQTPEGRVEMRCPHDGGKCHHHCESKCWRKDHCESLSEPWQGFPVEGDAPVPDQEMTEDEKNQMLFAVEAGHVVILEKSDGTKEKVWKAGPDDYRIEPFMERGNPPTRIAARNNAKTRIALERDRQIEKWGDGPMPIHLRLAILTEEVGEVAKAMQDETDRELLEELIQVGAVALRWAEDLLLEMDR